MVKLNDFLTSVSDIQIIRKSLFQSLVKLPNLILLNLFFMIIFIVIKGVYSYTFIFGNENDFIKALNDFNFSILQFVFLIFLVPFQLHWGSSKRKFSEFLKDTAWPIVIESCKAFAYLCGYVFLCGFVSVLILGGLNLIGIFDLEGIQDLESGLSYKAIPFYFLLFVIYLPLFIRSIQYNFIPFVVFFDKEYQETKKGAIKKSILVSKGAALLIIPLLFVLPPLLKAIRAPITEMIVPEMTSMSLTAFTIDSFVDLAAVICFCAFFYYTYHFKKSQ